MLQSTVLLESEALSLLQDLEIHSLLAIDTETNGEDIRDGRGYAMGMSLAWSASDALYLPFRHPGDGNYNLPLFRTVLQSLLDTHTIIFHNAKFDLVSLTTFGLDTSKVKFYDTMLLGHLVDENFPSKSLDYMSKVLLKDEGKKKSEEFSKALKLVGWAGLSADLICEYGMYDASLTFRLYENLKPRLKAEKLGPVWNHKQEFLRVIMSMEKRGVRIDVDKCRRMADWGHEEMEGLREELGGLNPASVKDLKSVFIDLLGLPVVKETPAGKPSFDKTAMAIYDQMLEESEDPSAKIVKAYRGWQKSVSSNYEAYIDPELLSPDGRLRPNYKLHGTRTGRMSCEKPNLQQIPRKGENPWNGAMKSCFIADPGYTLLEVDYSQLELRLGTAYAREESLIAVFEEGRDIFTEMAAQLGMARQDVKTLVYSIQYGAGVNRISTVFKISPAEATKRIQNYYNTYPNFRKVTQDAAREAEYYGRVQLWSGRYRHFTAPKRDSFKAFNSRIQGGAADVVERTMVRLDRNGFNTDECRMLLQVHDSVVFEIRSDLVDSYTPAIIEQFTREPSEFFGVTFAAEAKEWGH